MSFGHNFEDSRWADVTRNGPIGNGIPFIQTYQHSVSDVTGVVLFLVVTYPVSQRLGFEGLHGQEKSQLQREGEGHLGGLLLIGGALLGTARLHPRTPVHRAVPITDSRRPYGYDGLPRLVDRHWEVFFMILKG